MVFRTRTCQVLTRIQRTCISSIPLPQTQSGAATSGASLSTSLSLLFFLCLFVSFGNFLQLITHSSCYPAVSLITPMLLTPKEIKVYVPSKTCMLYVYSTLFLIANSWKQPKPAGARRRTLGSVFRTVLVLNAVHSLT